MGTEQSVFQEIGVVEGFYGRVWQPAERQAFIASLLPFGLNTYLYCPKHEPALAAEVLRPLNGEEAGHLGELATFCAGRGVALWVGLHLEPPLNVNNAAHLEAVAAKCHGLWKLGVKGFCIQFDDLSGAFDPAASFAGSLAALQAHAVVGIYRQAAALGVLASWLVVPALYTPDPLLEKTYGPFAPDYLARLDQSLPAQVAWMYTGPRVCAPSITLAHLEQWRGASRREVVLWDNYPVNDAAMVDNLHICPLTGRAPDLPERIRGYLFNPLLQPALGALPGATCLIYANDPTGYEPLRAWHSALAALLPEQGREAFGELEALTRHCCLEGFLPDQTFGPRGPLVRRLEQGWQALQNGGAMDAGTLQELRRVLDTLNETLPPAMASEARPWLERLTQAHAVCAARADSTDWRAAASAYRKGGAYVLGEWFRP
ncbi:MAG: beta-N-acetylglucosaminidase domain-containing protein [SAR324 cluster bacterium]|nr:beta-N-acetylglucosaminidase domain-containing protein [SAR324 cluster bacterium]